MQYKYVCVGLKLCKEVKFGNEQLFWNRALTGHGIWKTRTNGDAHERGRTRRGRARVETYESEGRACFGTRSLRDIIHARTFVSKFDSSIYNT